MSKLRFVIYKAGDGYRWRLQTRNNKIIADSAEAYSGLSKACGAVWNLVGLMNEDGQVTVEIAK